MAFIEPVTLKGAHTTLEPLAPGSLAEICVSARSRSLAACRPKMLG